MKLSDMNRVEWTPKLDKRLIKMWFKRATQAQIALELGVTKNTIAGRVNRLRVQGADLPRRVGGNPALRQCKLAPRVRKALTKSRTGVTKRKPPVTPPAPEKKPKPALHLRGDLQELFELSSEETPLTKPEAQAVSEIEDTTCTTLLLDLVRGQCRYIAGHDEGKRFCDGIAKKGSTMCEAHHEICYQPLKRAV